jgi:hypothetical protein
MLLLMPANGPAVGLVSVTGRSTDAESRLFRQFVGSVQALPAGRQGGYGAIFVIPIAIGMSRAEVTDLADE